MQEDVKWSLMAPVHLNGSLNGYILALAEILQKVVVAREEEEERKKKEEEEKRKKEEDVDFM